MTEHDRIIELLARRRELTSDEERQVQGHLELCPHCRDDADAFARQDPALALLGTIQSTESLDGRVLLADRRARRPILWPLAVAAAAVLAIMGGFSIVSGGGLPWIQPDRPGGQGYSGPVGGTFVPATPRAGAVSRSQAIQMALRLATGSTKGVVPPGVAVDAFLGTYTDTLFKPRLVWIVRFHGAGIEIPSDGGPMSPVVALLCPRPVAHEETVILDGRTGARVEITVGLHAQGLPITALPSPRPTPCPSPPPTMLAPVSLAVSARGTIVEVGQTAMRYEVQERSPDGRLLAHWPAAPAPRLVQQITHIAVDGHGNVYLIGNDQKVQKFTAGGHLVWQRALPGDYSGSWSIAVAPGGTVYVPERAPHVGIKVLTSSGTLRASWTGRYYQVAVGLHGRLYASRGGTITVLSTVTGARMTRWSVESALGRGFVRAMRTAPDGTAWLLESRFTRTSYLGYEIAHFTEDGHLLTRWHVSTKKGSPELAGSQLSDIEVDAQGRVYVADTGRARVLVFSQTGKLVRTW